MVRRSALALLGLVALGLAHAQTVPQLPYRLHTIRTPDGLGIAAYEYGNPAGPAILLIHGYAQGALSWHRQTSDPSLLREFRIVAYDIRGHGMSDKPVGDQYYKPAQPWGDELAAVIAQTGLDRPVLVGWSYAGRIINDYVGIHGTSRIGGINFVAASTSAVPSRLGRAGRHVAGMISPDPQTAIAATVAFLRQCFSIQPSASDFEMMVGLNMMVPRWVRTGLLGRPADFEATLRALDVPVLITHGREDQAIDITMAEYTMSVVPNATLSVYEQIGHSPFWEAPERFNRELAEFVRRATGR
jgi:pimeloyl-ACP methyl ester carboxylesterase